MAETYETKRKWLEPSPKSYVSETFPAIPRSTYGIPLLRRFFLGFVKQNVEELHVIAEGVDAISE